MRFSVLALDFDGTIAQNDVLDPGVRQAISELRAQGIVVLIVTGRILEDLRRVAGDLHFVDGVVAENGAVMEFPDTGYSTALGPPPPSRLLEELRRGGVSFSLGRTIVDLSADDAWQVLAIVRRLELPLMLAFNRGRMMLLPQAINKATGLRQILTILRLSPHNAAAIGDAENDHALLQVCEVGLAVAWGSAVLKASADYIVPGNGPAAVAAYIREFARKLQIPTPMKTRRRLLLGHSDDGQPLELAVRGRNLLIAGDPKSGKSWITGLLCEQLILYGYCLCIIDPEGDYTSLEALPGVVVLGGSDPLPRSRDLLRALRHPDVSVVIDLSHSSQQEKLDYVGALLPSLALLRRVTGLPHRIVVDEAHYFLGGSDIDNQFDLEQSGYTLVTCRASALHRKIMSATQAVIVARESDPTEVRALSTICAKSNPAMEEREWGQLLDKLVIGEAVVLPGADETGGGLRRIRLAPRLTPHVRHFAKYIDIPVPEARAFVFWRNGAPGRRARTLREFIGVVETTPSGTLNEHARRGDFSKWIAGVFGDYPLANSVRCLEDEYSAGTIADINPRLSAVIRARYDLIDPLAGRL